VRIVRTPGGTVEVDPTGKLSGRGAYLCRSRDCWGLALQRGHVARALKATLNPTDKDRLAQFAAGLPMGPEERDNNHAGAVPE
jgi:predicted RNA-binding protein YlxR (DUF448 family)